MSEVSKLNSNERVLITSIGCKIPLSMKGDLIKIAASKGLNTNQILAMMVEKLVMTDGEISFLEEDKVQELEKEKADILEFLKKSEEQTKKLEAIVLKNQAEIKKETVDFEKALKARERKEAEAIAKTATLEAKIKALEKELSTAKAGAAKTEESSSQSLKTLKNQLAEEQKKRQQLEAKITAILKTNNAVYAEISNKKDFLGATFMDKKGLEILGQLDR
jgi:chromosome segregation ATPase